MLAPINKKIKKGFFITGTDTNVGKTLIAASLSYVLINEGKRVCAIKPVASGCKIKNGKLVSNEAMMLIKYSTRNKLSYSNINPFALQDPVAPHLAAKKYGVKLSIAEIMTKSYKALSCDSDCIIIEGVGGWCTPINDQETIADLAKSYAYPVILVVGIKLGCINHAILTYKCMCSSGIKLAGWVANVIDKKMLYLEENIEALKGEIKAPLLGVVPYIKSVNPNKISHFLHIPGID